MELTLNIPRNDYKQPTEVRQNVVQAICDTFLCGNCYSVFHPATISAGKKRTIYVEVNKYGKGCGFFGRLDDLEYSRMCGHECYRINGVEMQAAFAALRECGYHIFRIYKYRSWMGYICDKKPYRNDGEEVTDFTDFID